MQTKRLVRALTVLAVPALLVPALATSAEAAPKPPAVPTLAAVTKIYPTLRGGDVEVQREVVRAAGKGCAMGKKVRGAVGREATYMPKMDPDATGFGVTGAAPMIDIISERLPSSKVTRSYVKGQFAQTRKCIDGGDPDVTVTSSRSFRVALGDQGMGYRAAVEVSGAPMTVNLVAVRAGKQVVVVSAVSMDTSAPSIPKTIRLARLALKTAR